MAAERLLNVLGLAQPEEEKLPTVFEQMRAEFNADVEKKKQHVASAPWFNITVGFLIVLDTALIGVEVDFARGEALEDRVQFFVLNFLFALAFFVEMLVRQNQVGWDYFIDAWNIFDFSLVVLNCADVVTTVSNDGMSGFSLAPTLRVLRLMRAVRMIRGLKMFYSLWMLIQGMLDSLRTMAWVVLLLGIIFYIAAVTLATLVHQTDYVQVRWRYSDMYLGSVLRCTMTMFQVVTLDNWASDVARPLAEVSTAGIVILIVAIIICNFGLLNIIIAVMVERVQTISQVTKDITTKVLENTEADILKAMGEEFREMDTDGSNELDFEEFKELLRKDTFLYKLRLLNVQCDEAENLFEIMDADQSGTVSPEEFIKGILKLRGAAKGQDLVQVICFAQKQCLTARRNVDRMQKLNRKADEIQIRLNEIGKRISSEQRERKVAEVRNDDVWKKAAQRTSVITQMDHDRRIQFPSIKME